MDDELTDGDISLGVISREYVNLDLNENMKWANSVYLTFKEVEAIYKEMVKYNVVENE